MRITTLKRENGKVQTYIMNGYHIECMERPNETGFRYQTASTGPAMGDGAIVVFRNLTEVKAWIKKQPVKH